MKSRPINWVSLSRPSRFFAVAALLLFAAGFLPLARGRSGVAVEVLLEDSSVVLSSIHIYLVLGGVFLIFAGVYGLFEERHNRPANLILGHVHFWLSLFPLLLVLSVLQRHSSAAAPGGSILDFRSLAQSEMQPLRLSLFTFFGAQFAFLANLAWSFMHKEARAR